MGLRGRAFGVLSISLVMAWMGIASLLPEPVRRASPWIPDTGVQLGLDLQGGVHWLLAVDRAQVVQRRLEASAEAQLGSGKTWRVDGGVLEACGAEAAQRDALASDPQLERRGEVGGCARFALTADEQTRALG